MNMVGTEGVSHLMLLMVLLLSLPSAPGQAIAAAEGHGGGAEPSPGGDCQNGGQAGRADSAAGAGELMLSSAWVSPPLWVWGICLTHWRFLALSL